ncbi:hypothetical protein R7070_21185 [Vibrio sp. 1557]|uniref:phage baseplate protein n=1 Tax=Vibrio sp. 1557 TaxID=3074561 RepID=UPI0021CE998A|nr:hypothetical protein [Vibrio sp. 1557]EJV5949162.1 hypothetical protein [Vibrio alginolyticus]MDW2265272.1 hypothetical protein [Vibrio sp. 1557]
MIVPTYLMDDKQGRFYADAFTELVPTWNANASKYPISDKSVIANHVIRQNPTLNMTFYISQNPIKDFNGNLISGTDNSQRPTNAHEILLKWFNNSSKLTIVNEFFNLDSYVIVSYQPRQHGTTGSMEYSVNLEHIRNVSYTRSTLLQFADTSKSIDAQSKTSQSDSSAKSQSETKKSMSEQVWEFYNDNGITDLQKQKSNEQVIKEFNNRGANG